MANDIDKVLLPSKGLLEGIPKEITIRNMKTSDEKLLLGSYDEAIDEILKACITSPDESKIDISNWTPADRHYALIRLRMISYGPILKVNQKCPFCGGVSEFSIDLSQLECEYLPDGFTEPYDTFELPVAGDTVALAIPRMKDVRAVAEKAKKWNKKFPEAKGDISYIFGLMSVVSTVNGAQMRSSEKQRWIEELAVMDSSFIRNRVSEFELGVDPNITVTCPKPACGEDFDFVLPLGADFFRSDVGKRRGPSRKDADMG